MSFKFSKDAQDNDCLEVSVSDYALISNPLLNKGMGFSSAEREMFSLYGLIPAYETSISIQAERSFLAFQNKKTDLEKYIYLRDLQNSNEVLFYYVIHHHIAEMMPIVYTPTVGLGCQQFSQIYRRPRGIFISYPDIQRIEKILANPRFDMVKAIVVSDGERILGLGDQGAGGMGIPIGKLSLYTACAGIHPAYTLPILLDTGTNNQERLNDPLYIGWRHERVRGKEYDDFIAAFVTAIKKRFSHVLLQWEDFAQQNANPILARYREQLCTFNDDIQGTAAVAVGTLLSAIQVTKKKLVEQKIVILGAGSAGCGISNLILQAMVQDGLTEEQAAKNFYLIDREGLLLADMSNLLDFQKPFAQQRAAIKNWQVENQNNISFVEVVKNVHPTVLIGVSGQRHIFSEAIVREMAAHCERPIIFPLSNPTDRTEAEPVDLLKWTNNQAIIGTGSPFADVEINGKVFHIAQTNNSYVFPGVGLGLIAIKAKQVTDSMFMMAAKALAECSPAKNNSEADILPPLSEIRAVSLKVAIAVAKEAVSLGLAQEQPAKNETLEDFVARHMWEPHYLPYVKSKS